MAAQSQSGWGPTARQEAGTRGHHERRRLYGWLSLGLCVMGALLSLVLLQRPIIFIGAADVGLPLLLAGAGMVLARKAGKPLKWISLITGGFVVLLIVVVVLLLTSGGSGVTGTEIGDGLGAVSFLGDATFGSDFAPSVCPW